MIEGAERGLGSFAQGDDDLFEGYRRAVTGGKNSGQRGWATCIHFDLAARRASNRSIEPVGIRQQTDLYEHALER